MVVPFKRFSMRQSLCLFIKRRVRKIDIFLIHLIFGKGYGFAKPLEMDNLPLTEESNHVGDIRIVTHTQNVVVCDARLLLGSHIFREITDDVALDRHTGRTPWESGGRCRIDACGMIDKIGGELCHTYIVVIQVTGKLVHNGANHLKVSEFFGTDIGQ